MYYVLNRGVGKFWHTINFTLLNQFYHFVVLSTFCLSVMRWRFSALRHFLPHVLWRCPKPFLTPLLEDIQRPPPPPPNLVAFCWRIFVRQKSLFFSFDIMIPKTITLKYRHQTFRPKHSEINAQPCLKCVVFPDTVFVLFTVIHSRLSSCSLSRQ